MIEKTNSGVVLDIRVGEELRMDLDSSLGLDLGPIRVKVEKKDGQRARLRVVADQRIIIRRPVSGSR